tara:strand:- start:2315 stop:4813 length:2499 start_codon:yes stop_codon:yes gene_type:complete
MALTYRSVKGSALTITELDDNFRHFTGSHSISGSLTISGSLIPEGSGSYDLGSVTNPWREIYVMSSSIRFMGEGDPTPIGSISVRGDGRIDLGSGGLQVSGSSNLTGSFNNTGSFYNIGAFNNDGNAAFTGSITASGNISSSGTVTANEFVGGGAGITGVTAEWDGSHTGDASITGSFYVSGSGPTEVKFGNSFTWSNPTGSINFTGSLNTSGSINLTGSINISGSGNIVTSNQTGSFVNNNQTGSFVNNNQTGSFATTGSNSFTGSLNVSGSVIITGSLTVSGSGTFTNIGPFDQTGTSTFTGQITASGNISSSGTVSMLTASIGGGTFTSASLAAGGGGGGGTTFWTGSGANISRESDVEISGSFTQVSGSFLWQQISPTASNDSFTLKGYSYSSGSGGEADVFVSQSFDLLEVTSSYSSELGVHWMPNLNINGPVNYSPGGGDNKLVVNFGTSSYGATSNPNVYFRGTNSILGHANISGSVGNISISSLIPTKVNEGTVGSSTYRYNTGYINNLTSTNITASGNISASGDYLGNLYNSNGKVIGEYNVGANVVQIGVNSSIPIELGKNTSDPASAQPVTIGGNVKALAGVEVTGSFLSSGSFTNIGPFYQNGTAAFTGSILSSGSLFQHNMRILDAGTKVADRFEVLAGYSDGEETDEETAFFVLTGSTVLGAIAPTIHLGAIDPSALAGQGQIYLNYPISSTAGQGKIIFQPVSQSGGVTISSGLDVNNIRLNQGVIGGFQAGIGNITGSNAFFSQSVNVGSNIRITGSELSITGSLTVTGSGIAAYGSSSFYNLPTSEPRITGSLWVSGSGLGSASGSGYLMVFTGL